MISLMRRQIKLFFANKANPIFSMLGALISFVLYIIFLQKNMTEIWPDNQTAKLILDWWVIGGILAVVSMTTSWHIGLRLISDRETNRLNDLLLTDTSVVKVYNAYFMSSSLVALIMQVMMFSIMLVYFHFKDGINLSFEKLPALLLLMILSSILGGVASILVSCFIKTIEVGERLSVMIGTLSGFLVGVYMPLGSMPDFALQIIKLVPGAYVAAAYRELLIGSEIEKLILPDKNLREFLGLGIKWNTLTSFSSDVYLIVAISLLLFFMLLCKVHQDNRTIK